MKVAMMAAVVLTMVVGCNDAGPEPQAAAGAAAGSSGAGGSEVLACEDSDCSAACFYNCGEAGACVAVDGGPPACACDCQ